MSPVCEAANAPLMMRTPMMVPMMPPRPPDRLVPPMTTAAMVSSS